MRYQQMLAYDQEHGVKVRMRLHCGTRDSCPSWDVWTWCGPCIVEDIPDAKMEAGRHGIAKGRHAGSVNAEVNDKMRKERLLVRIGGSGSSAGIVLHSWWRLVKPVQGSIFVGRFQSQVRRRAVFDENM